MAITISGQNNNDKILASDGVLDSISGFNVVGVMTAAQFDVTGKTSTGHLNVGSNIHIGNAGIITATTLVGNVTGNINHTSNLLLQIGGSEKFRVGNGGQFGIAGANYGTAGQVFTSGGSGSAPTWSTINSDKITEGNTEAEVYDNGSDGRFTVKIDDTERLRINNTGIGTFKGDLTFGENSKAKLFENGNNQGIQCTHSSSSAHLMTHDGNEDIHVDPSGYIRFEVAGSERLRITSAGRVGIDRTSPLTMLDIKVPPLNTATITTTNCLTLGMLLTSGGTGSNTEGHIYNGLAVGDGYAGLYGKDGGSSAATDLEFFTGTSSAVAGRVRIQDDGKIIIGGNVSQSINRNVSIVAPTGNSQDIVIGLQPTNSSGGYNPEAYIGATADGTYGAAMYFYTRDTSGNRAERVRIASDGKLLIGHNAAQSVGGGNSLLQIQATNSTGRISVVQHRNEAGGSPFISLGKSRGTSNGSTTILQSGDEIGTLTWAGADGNDLDNQACCITGVVDGTPGSNDMPGRLEFRTTADGSASATTRMKISKEGYVTKPNQPRALVKIYSTTTMGNGKVDNWASPTYNVGSLWDTTNKRFVAPTDGLYLIGGNFRIGAPGKVRVTRFEIRAYNTSNVQMAGYGGGVGGGNNYDGGSGGYDHPYVGFTNAIYLQTGQYLELWLGEVGTEHTTYIQTSNEQSHMWCVLLQ